MELYIILYIGPDRIIVFIFSFISFNICFAYRDSSFEYPQHMLKLIKRKLFFSYSLLSKYLFIINRGKSGTIRVSNQALGVHKVHYV